MTHTAAPWREPGTSSVVRLALIAALIVSLVANAALIARVLRRQMMPRPEGAASEPQETQGRPAPRLASPNAPLASASPGNGSCGEPLAILEMRIAEARAALEVARPGEVFRKSAPNPRAAAELKPWIEPVLAPSVPRDVQQLLECRGTICRLELITTSQLYSAGVPLHEAITSGQLGRADKILSLDVSPTLDPATKKRRFSTQILLHLGDSPRGSPPPRSTPTGGARGTGRKAVVE